MIGNTNAIRKVYRQPESEYYGVEWGRVASPVWTRVGAAEGFSDPVPYILGMSAGDYSSPFDNIYPWSGMVRVTDPEAGELVKIPKFYYRWVNDASKMRLEIRGSAADGYHTSPAHIDRGDGHGERDYVYIGRYHCSSTDYKSTSGVTPKVSITRASARSAISALGATVWQMDHAMWWTIGMLYLVEFANANCQGMIGYGRGNGSGVQAMGYTDSMPYHTGTTLSSKTTYGASTQYRNIEGLWDNCCDWCDGIYFNNASIYHILNPANFSDSAGGASTGTRTTTNGLAITGFTFPAVTGYEWAGYPGNGDVGDSTSTGSDYFCDNEYNGSTGVVLFVGGSYQQALYYGLFSRDGGYTSGSAYARIGARLMKLP